jgi:transaldolase/glucose-6-phosphate isomerase
MNRIRELGQHGQSIWYDYIQRGMIWTGALYRMVVEDGLKGVTSNPAIFEKAIGKSADYEAALGQAVREGASPREAYEQLAIADLQLACDVLARVHAESGGKDGYVSLEVSPYLADDTDGTIQEGLRLWEEVGRANLMIKVPATEAGLPAIEALISEGVNVNVTLLFSVERYEAVHQAYLAGLERLAARGGDVRRVASVASFFVSRIDTLIDAAIDERLVGGANLALAELKGRVAIANAKLAYRSYREVVAGARWQKLAAAGAMPQRLLWASTGTKNPAYRDTLYVEELIGPDTVNTVPEATYEAFKDHGVAEPRLLSGLDDAQRVLETLAAHGISLASATAELERQGVVLFQQAFDRLIGAVQARRERLLGSALPTMQVELGSADEAVRARLSALGASGFTRRLWAKDGTLFGASAAEQAEAARYMGWLHAVEHGEHFAMHLGELQEDLSHDGIETVLLMGMGGSSLAPEVFAKTFGQLDGAPELVVLDSTVPAQVKAIADAVEPESAVYVVASKSGTTSEPLAFDAFFFDAVGDGERFVAITDPGSKLESMALERDFRGVYNGDPEIGGRYSALSPFGLVPAAAMGLDPVDLLERARRMVGSCEAEVPPEFNAGVKLGAALGELALGGRDKLTLISSPGLAAFGAWVEQLVAESTGKHGKGIVPVDLECLGEPSVYGADRVFAYLEVAGEEDATTEARLAALAQAGHPVLRFRLGDKLDLVQEMFRWEVATATAGHVLGINPFDQPNVQESKTFTAQLLAEHAKTRKRPSIPGEVLLLEAGGIRAYADEANAAALSGAKDLAGLLEAQLGRVRAGDYVALNAYVAMNSVHTGILQKLRHAIRDSRKVATTLGFGPRFLHSTGQLHKGGANNGVFFQLTADDAEALEIPGLGYSFSVLKAAQEAGDFMALSSRGRRLVRLHLGKDVAAGLEALARALPR